jgi:hypothetical protein
MFDFKNAQYSPLLAPDGAEAYLRNLADSGLNEAGESNPLNQTQQFYAEKLEHLLNFKKALKTINNDMPWYWQSLAGLDRLLKYDPNNSYWGGDDAELTITTLESINLAIAGLMQLYRNAVFNDSEWKFVLPSNLRNFKMYVYVTEVRTIKNMSAPKINGLNTNEFPENFKPSIGVVNTNAEISGQSARPYFMFEFKYCEFKIDSGSIPFADLQKNPEGPATNEIKIHYEALNKIESRALNGIITTEYNTDKLSPAPDSETESPSNLQEWALSKANQRLSDLQEGAITSLQNLSRQKQQELQMAAANATVNRVPNFENVFQNFVQGVDNATNINQQTRDIGGAIVDNIYGTQSGETIGDALARGAVNSLGNVYG